MKRLLSVFFLFITLILPFFLIMSSIRILLIPYIFPDFEYRLPGFPDDTYGFTQADRLKWSKVSIEYLINDQPISWLANQKLPNGTPLYIDRELSHMLDVKNLIQVMFVAWWVFLVLIFAAGLASWRWKNTRDFWRSVSNGGWLTLALIVTVLVFVVISFNELFTNFHRIFFSGDSWLFLYSDSLIRLFPIRFWQDAFIWMGVFTIIFALLLGVFGRQLSKSSK